MRVGVWKLAIVAAGIGLAFVLADVRSGAGRVEFGPSERAGTQATAGPVNPGTQVEVRIHRLVPGTMAYLIGGDAVHATRDEAAMLDGLRVGGERLAAEVDGHRVWLTLINHTDTGYLLSERDFGLLVRTETMYTDEQGRRMQLVPTAMGNPDGYVEAYTIPLAPNGRREMVVPIAFVRVEPPWNPDRPGERLPFPGTVRYTIEPPSVGARPIIDGTLGEPVRLKVAGSGTCEVSFDGPM